MVLEMNDTLGDSTQASGSTLLVTGADAAYFPLMLELVLSIRQHPQGKDQPIGVIDAGLTEEQKDILAGQNCLVRKFENHTPRIEKAIAKRKALTVNLGKLWLDVIFPEYDLLVFLDADTWVQDWTAISYLVGAAAEGALAVVGSWHRYRDSLPVRWYLGLVPVYRSFNFKAAYHAHLPLSVIKTMSRCPDLNAGVYALQRTAPHWQRMRAWQDVILKKGRPFTSDGLAMALVCGVDGLALQRMPVFCNYTEQPVYDDRQKLFRDSFYPHAPVGIIHLAAQKAVRFDPDATLTYYNLAGEEHRINPRYNPKTFRIG